MHIAQVRCQQSISDPSNPLFTLVMQSAQDRAGLKTNTQSDQPQ
jgi:hypothetical protein